MRSELYDGEVALGLGLARVSGAVLIRGLRAYTAVSNIDVFFFLIGVY